MGEDVTIVTGALQVAELARYWPPRGLGVGLAAFDPDATASPTPLIATRERRRLTQDDRRSPGFVTALNCAT